MTAVLTLGAPITAALQLVSAGQLPAPDRRVGYGIGPAVRTRTRLAGAPWPSRATTVTQPAVQA